MTKTVEILFLISCIAVFLFVVPIQLSKQSDSYMQSEFKKYQIDEYAWQLESYYHNILAGVLAYDLSNVTMPDNVIISFYDDSFIYLYSDQEAFVGGINTNPPRYAVLEDAVTHYKKGVVLN